MSLINFSNRQSRSAFFNFLGKFGPYVLGVVFLVLLVFFFSSNVLNLRAATYNWIQTIWSGGASSAVANHGTNQTGWTFYNSKDTNLKINSNTLQIATSSGAPVTENTNASFEAGAVSNAYVLNNSVVMQKPIGANCSTAAECGSNYCDSGTLTCQIPPVACDGSNGTLVCGNLCTYQGDVYNTVQIGTQCWFADNLRTTVYPNGSVITKGDPNDPGHGGTTFGTSATAYYSCPSNFNHSGEDCSAAGGTKKLGMYYQWNTVMNGASYVATGQGPQGICPTGWHVPTDDKTTNSDIGLLLSAVDNISGCTGNEATCLRSGGASGFDFPWSGYRTADGWYWDPSQYAQMWTASQDQPGGWWRWDDLSGPTVSRKNSNDMAMPVRCVRNY